MRIEDAGSSVILSGWVFRRRDHGGLIFIDLRDGYGISQIVFDPHHLSSDLFNLAESLRNEFLIRIEGKVRSRPVGQDNPKLVTGKIEILVDSFRVLNDSPVLPFVIDRDEEVGEEIRLEYRYLDLRREKMRRNLKLRHKINKYIRDFLDRENFFEIETPMMIKGTPEGSREYVIPSRIHQGNFYVLPQSPQQLKQLLMIAGMDRYFQIVRCFRDEDLRGDRQPEFTQLDMEVSFENEEFIMRINEKLALELVKKFRPDIKILEEPFPRITYFDAMSRFGSDKPDLRYSLEMCDISDLVEKSSFGVFSNAIKNGGAVKALKVDGGAKYSRKELADYEEIAKIFGAKGMAYIINDRVEGPKSPILKFFGKNEINVILERTNCEPGDAIFFAADSLHIACRSLGAVRAQVAKNEGLIDENLFAFAWIVDFPLFERNEETGQFASAHHPFTAPKPEQEFLLDSDPMSVLSRAYDLILNGSEIGGGSIRIHDQKLQAKIFDVLGITGEERSRRFGHLLKALSFAAPPHGGIAWGLDRFLMIMLNEPNIREVIPFPKDQKGRDLMLHAPSLVPDEQLRELGISLRKT